MTEFGKPERVGKGVKGWRMYKITVRTKSRVRVQRVYNPFSLKIAVEQCPSCFFCHKERKEHKEMMFLLIIHAVRSVHNSPDW